MNQKKKLDALNKLLNEITNAIDNVKTYEKENFFLDKLVKEFNILNPLPNLKAEIEDEYSEEGMEPNEYYYHSDFGPKAPSAHSNYQASKMSEKKRKNYYDTLAQNKKFMIDIIDKFEAFLFDNYNIELSSAKKRITENTIYVQKYFFIKQCQYPICASLHLSDPGISFSLINNKYNSDLVKEFKKSVLTAFYEKRQLESVFTDDKVLTNKKTKTIKI